MTNTRETAIREMFTLLERSKSTFAEEEFGGLVSQHVAAPTPITQGIPTLEQGSFRAATPMIEARFTFAGRWTDAGGGQTWLGIGDMQAVWTDERIMRQIRSKRDFWEGSAPATVEWRKLTLFGLDIDEEDHTYLVWNDQIDEEPAVWIYSGQSERKFKNMMNYLKYIVGD